MPIATTLAAVMIISSIAGATVNRLRPLLRPGFYEMLETCAEIPSLAGFMMMVRQLDAGIRVDLSLEDHEGWSMSVSDYSAVGGKSRNQCYVLYRILLSESLVPHMLFLKASEHFPHLDMRKQEHFLICPDTEGDSATVKLRLRSGGFAKIRLNRPINADGTESDDHPWMEMVISGREVGEQTAAIVFNHRIEGQSTVGGFKVKYCAAGEIAGSGYADDHTYARSYGNCCILEGQTSIFDTSSAPASQDRSKVPARVCAESDDSISVIYEGDDGTERKFNLLREDANLSLLADVAV
ncbi:hypothetical protein FOZ63_017896 [Perkinsus olseni]|uniref:Uncharacterized protein n=1 Tax=Perkinsus olseni TaxID=32597 RepID=A0A7J6UME0_PEROL|nr:hypothetical protein FOZ62_000473 [Perkinsus olseni]KAF4758161.1 hypothetical protein FOZ63_017896 [Perkinsus olseni]